MRDISRTILDDERATPKWQESHMAEETKKDDPEKAEIAELKAKVADLEEEVELLEEGQRHEGQRGEPRKDLDGPAAPARVARGGPRSRS